MSAQAGKSGFACGLMVTLSKKGSRRLSALAVQGSRHHVQQAQRSQLSGYGHQGVDDQQPAHLALQTKTHVDVIGCTDE